MSYEKEIPAFALQPARAPKMTSAEAVYHTENVICPEEKQTAVYQFEEDILVPDTKADMKEILLMDAVCSVVPPEKKVMPKTDDLLNFTGLIELQTLYNPDNESREPVAITSKVPYKYQWSLNPPDQAEGVFSCRVKALEYMIINERKFRVKVTLEFTAQLFCQKTFSFFDGLKDDTLEMKTTEVSMGCLEMVKKDETAIDEIFRPRESEGKPEAILNQKVAVIENYRQVTTEKIVINGFIFVNLLYMTKAEEEKPAAIAHHHERIEFTQFIPIGKEHRGKKWSAVKTSFHHKDLMVVMHHGEGEGEESGFRIKVTVETRVELYQNRSRQMVTDAYHREKEFVCQFQKQQTLSFYDCLTTEFTLREMINLPEGCKAAEAVCSDCRVFNYGWSNDRGKLVVTGSLRGSCLWKNEEGLCQTTKVLQDFQHVLDADVMEKRMKTDCRLFIKDCWLTLLNDKQIELNCALVVRCEFSEEKELILLEEPAFVQCGKGKEYPMVVVILKEGQSLWDLAKKYRTTEKLIWEMNGLEKEPEAGQKLLMMK